MAKSQNANNEKTESPFRDSLSKWIGGVAILGVILLALVMLVAGYVKGDTNSMQSVFTAVLPLFGAWVGTILAFYYGKENFESATRSVTKIAEAVNPSEKLKEIPVKDKMIAKNDLIFDDRPVDQIKLVEILKKMSDKERLPILNDKGAVLYMIHRSFIDRYLTQKALQSPPPNLNDITLDALLKDDQDLNDKFQHTFGFVKEDATLADAKAAMEAIDKCQDIFVTSNADKTKPILGLITNNKIQDAAKL